jgi:hypothetical protein
MKVTKDDVGSLVMSFDAGNKLIRAVAVAHAPYILEKVTRGGLAILKGREEFRIPSRLLRKVDDEV